MTGLCSIASRKSIDLVSSIAWRTVASRRAGEPYRSSAGLERRNWIVLDSRSFSPGQRFSIFSAMSRSAKRTKRGRKHERCSPPRGQPRHRRSKRARRTKMSS